MRIAKGLYSRCAVEILAARSEATVVSNNWLPRQVHIDLSVV